MSNLAPKAGELLLADVGIPAIVTLVEDQYMITQALCDLVAIATPSDRADWSGLLIAAARVQHELAAPNLSGLAVALASLVTDIGLTLNSAELTRTLDTAHEMLKKYTVECTFAIIAHSLAVIARY